MDRLIDEHNQNTLQFFTNFIHLKQARCPLKTKAKNQETRKQRETKEENELVLGPAGWFQKDWSLLAAMRSIIDVCFSCRGN